MAFKIISGAAICFVASMQWFHSLDGLLGAGRRTSGVGSSFFLKECRSYESAQSIRQFERGDVTKIAKSRDLEPRLTNK